MTSSGMCDMEISGALTPPYIPKADVLYGSGVPSDSVNISSSSSPNDSLMKSASSDGTSSSLSPSLPILVATLVLYGASTVRKAIQNRWLGSLQVLERCQDCTGQV